MKAAVDANMSWLAVLGVIASVIGAFYYLRMVYYMWFGSEPDGVVETRMGGVQWLALMGATAITLFGAFTLFGTDRAAERAAASLVVAEAAPVADPVAVATAPVD